MPRTRRNTRMEQALAEIYAQIPRIPDCSGACAAACGPIAAHKGEWERVTRAHGRRPQLRKGSLTCPMLSPSGWCTVYSVRPFICRLWGTTPTLACPQGCRPERWLSIEEARALFERVSEVAGPQIDGTLGALDDLWEGFALEARQRRAEIIDQVKEALRAGQA